MSKETRYISLAEFRGLEGEGSGTLTGYADRFNDLNDYGEITLKGAYARTIKDFLTRGFNCVGHNWTDGDIGFPTSAEEDNIGLLTTMQFHSTDDAQRVRTKALERMQNGKSVGLSIGFVPVRFIDIYPKDYDRELPKYLRSDRLQELMTYARQFPRIRVIQEKELYEYSIVTAPSQANATALSVRTMKEVEKRGEMLGEYIEESMTVAALSQLTDRLFWGVLYSVLYDSTKTKQEKIDTLSLALEEYKSLFLKVADALLESDETEQEEAMAEIRALYGDAESRKLAQTDLRASLQLNQHSGIARAAITGFSARMKALAELLQRQGKVLSKKNRDMLNEHCDMMEEQCTKIRELLDATADSDSEERSGNQQTRLRLLSLKRKAQGSKP